MFVFSDGFQNPGLAAASVAGTPRDQAGILGDPGTSMLGESRLADDVGSGVRIGYGRWLDDCGNTAITGSLFWIGGNETTANYPGTDGQIISRPFFNVDPAVNAPDSELVNFPGVVNGTMSVTADTDIFSAGIGVRKKLSCCENACTGRSQRVDFGFGYRHFSVEDTLFIREILSPVSTTGFLPAGTQYNVVDDFKTENIFNGVEFSLLGSWQRQRWVFEAFGNVAVGNVRQRALIDGTTTVSVPGVPPGVQPYGILAGPSNIGTYERDEFGVLSEARLEIGYWLTQKLKVQVGYNFVSLNSVTRPGTATDQNVNGTMIDPLVPDTGPQNPAFQWDDETFFLHALTLGAELRF